MCDHIVGNHVAAHMVWLLKRTVQKHMIKLMDKKNIHNFALKFFAYLDQYGSLAVYEDLLKACVMSNYNIMLIGTFCR